MATATNQGQKTKAEVEMGKFIQDTLELSPEDVEKLSVRYKNEQFDYLLTYDMGCGNSSAALISLTRTFMPRMISWPNSDARMSDVTILGRDFRGNKYSGDYAINLSGSIENFKCLPTSENLDRKYVLGPARRFSAISLREVWKAYFNITLSHCLDYANSHAALVGGKPVTWGNTLLLVAHPAGPAWSKELPNYREMIMEATGLPSEQVITFSEAKASMMYARQKKENGQFILQGGVDSLVIDLGASTIDVLHVDALGNPKKEFSIAFAGRDVDEVIGYAALNDLFPDFMVGQPRNKIPPASFFKNHELNMDRTKFKFSIRFAKEDACKAPGEEQILPMAPDKVSTVDAKRILNLLQKEKFCVTGVDMDFAKFMNKNAGSDSVTGTWNEILTNVVAYTAKDMDPNQPCQIVVSGGTANLVGVKDCVENGAYNAGFANPKLVMLNKPNDYDRTVPIGSGEYMLRVLNNLDTLEKFPQMLVQDVTRWLKDKATRGISDCIAEDAINKVNTILNTWAEKQNDSSADDLRLEFGKIQYSQAEVNDLCDINKMIVCHGRPLQLIDGLKNTINKKCNKLLSSISPVKHNLQYVFKIPNLTVPSAIIEDSVKKACTNINWLYHQTNWAYFWHSTNNTRLLSKKQRKHIRDNWLIDKKGVNRNTIQQEIRNVLLSELDGVCTKTEGFGIPDAIMADMKPLLGLAMFQQADEGKREENVN